MKRKIWFMLMLLCTALMLVTASNYAQFLPSSEQQRTRIQQVDWQNVQIDKVEVYKNKREVVILQKDQVIKTYKMRLGFDPQGHKIMEGDGKTPEGLYTLDWRNPESAFYKSLHISYPNEQDLAQAAAKGVSAGGLIMIHGSNSSQEGNKGGLLYNYLPRDDWTLGCIAVSNQDMDELWEHVVDGTPIEIFP